MILCSVPWTMLPLQYTDGETMSFKTCSSYHRNFSRMSFNMRDVRCNCSMGAREGEQASNPFVASAVVKQHPWFGFFTILRSFLVSREQTSNKISNYLISRVKTLLSGKWVALPKECTCLLCWTGKHQTQNGWTDCRKENPGKCVRTCAVMATWSQRDMANN